MVSQAVRVMRVAISRVRRVVMGRLRLVRVRRPTRGGRGGSRLVSGKVHAKTDGRLHGLC